MLQTMVEKCSLEEGKPMQRMAGGFTRFADVFSRALLIRDAGADEARKIVGASTIRIGMWVVLGVFGTFGMWAAFAPLDSAAVAQGTVVLDTNKKTIQHLEGGIIEAILVHEGVTVKAGQPLVKLSQTAAKSKSDLLRAQYFASRAAERRLLAERDGKEVMEITPELQAASARNPEIADMVDSQKRLFESRKLGLSGQIDVLNQRIEQLKDEIGGMQAQENAARSQLVLIREEIGGVRTLYQSGNAPKTRLLALQRKETELEGSRGEYLAKIARAKQTISETQMEIINARNEALNKIVDELRKTQVDLSTLEEQVRASKDILDRVTIYAPQSGIVTGLKFHTKGGVITPGTPIMDIIPQDDKLIIEAKVHPQDIDVVHKGLHAKVRLTAYKARRIPPLKGEVISISADRFVNEQRGESYYLARIEVDQTQLKDTPDVVLYPGMPADTLIVTGERTLLSYLFTPLSDAMYHGLKEQ
jgi:HlyD family type I secretion membrane fusion protein